MEKLQLVKPDVLLLDINMPKKNGLEVLKSLKSRRSKLKVLVLSWIYEFYRSCFKQSYRNISN